MSATVAVLSLHRHPRLRYVLRVLGADLGYRFRLFTSTTDWQAATTDARMVLGGSASEVLALRLPTSPFLSGKPATPAELETQWSPIGMPVFFEGDLLACCCFALTRYEEYDNDTKDQHDRFPAAASHAARNHYLHLPVVRMWAQQLATRLRGIFPDLPAPQQSALRFVPTYDIDALWAYHHRGWRGPASAVRDLLRGAWGRFRERIGSQPHTDPFYRLEELLALHPEQTATVFWLLSAKDNPYNVNPYPIPPAQIHLMQQLAHRVTMGIHPGYDSTLQPEKIRAEIDRLRAVTGRAPRHSRQHFLRLQLPATYRALRLQGISDDHSMGYADDIGWRAGTNLPFPWYDLENENITGLQIHPFAAMDVSLKNYLRLSPEEAVEKVRQLAHHCRPFGGDFPLLWHNSSLSEQHGWAGWKDAYAEMIRSITQ